MRRRARYGAAGRGLLTIICCLSVASIAWAADSRQTASERFTTAQPRTPTGLRTDIDYVNPDDPGAKPPAARRVVIKLARGARINTSVPGRCTASDAELMAVGEAACPKGSRVGKGLVTVDTGLPRPGRFVTAEIAFFNNTDQLIYLNTVQGTSARTVIRAEVTRRRIITNAAMLPGTPPDGGAIDTVDVDIKRVVDEDGRAYVRTPRRCPERGFWRNRLKFTYYDDVTQTVRSRSRCEG